MFCLASLLSDPEAADGVRQGSPGVEEDVLQAEPLLSSQRAVQRHAASLHTLPHPFLEGEPVCFSLLIKGLEQKLWR